MKKIFFLALVAFALLSSSTQAQFKAGRTGAAFLKIGSGARSVAMGSAVGSQMGDAEMAFWNPAGTALESGQKGSVSFNYNKWIADLKHNSVAIGYNLHNKGTVTLGVQSLGLNDIPANRQNGYTDPVLIGLITDTNTSETYSYRDMAISATYAKYFTDRLTMGATVKFINESIDGVSGSAVGFDFGSIYKIGVADWQISSRISNLGTGLKFYNQNNPLPLTFAVGTSLMPFKTKNASLLIAADTVKPQDAPQLVFTGAELNLYNLLYLRGGYKWNYTNTEDGGNTLRQSIQTSIEGMSFGAGIQQKMGNYKVGIDYAFTEMNLLNSVHRISLRVGF
jgi:hypothetical protein